MMFSPIVEIIDDIRNGRMVVVVDDADRENEGDVIFAASQVTPEKVNFMARECRGLICTPCAEAQLRNLQLEQMVSANDERMKTAFTVSVDAAQNVTTGISAHDRAETIRILADPESLPGDLVRPGHIFPLCPVRGGVLKRAGHTEAAVDLARLAGLPPVAVICEIINDDGTMARLPDLEAFAQKHQLKMCTVAEIIAHRLKSEKLVHHCVTADLPTKFGQFTLHVYRSETDDQLHLALCKGDLAPGHRPIDEPVLVRMHSECFTGDVLGSLRCDCGDQLGQALQKIDAEGLGALVYLRQEGRGIGLQSKLEAYALIDNKGLDTVEANEELGFEADLRDYGSGAQILLDLGVRRLRNMTNNPRKVAGLEGYGLEIVERVPIEIAACPENEHYLRTKKDKLGHILGM